jgi:hypothetical protein
MNDPKGTTAGGLSRRLHGAVSPTNGQVLRFALAAMAALACGCASKPKSVGIPPEEAADYLHTVIEADRGTYAEQVVNRLQNVEHKINASEHFREEKVLPLPSQMFRMAAQEAAKKSKFRYALISTWAINKVNTPKTDFEKKALDALQKSPDAPYRSTETVGGKTYFLSAYADKAVSEACVNCHNNHEESPRHDFKVGDVMGGVIVSLPVD